MLHPLLFICILLISYVLYHHRYIAEIIGKGGASIKALQNATGVRITTPNAPTAAGKGPVVGAEVQKVRIGLAGPREKVLIAKAAIKDITKYYHTEITHPGVTHVELDVPTTYFNFIIGAKGSEIKHIQNSYKVNVYVPNANSVNQNLLIVGKEDGVQSAQHHIDKLIEKYNTPKEPAAAPASAESALPNPTAAAKSGKTSMDYTPKIRKEEEEPEEEWMKEFTTSKRAPIDMNAMLPPSAKFLPSPTVAAETSNIASETTETTATVAPAAANLPPGSAWSDKTLGQKIAQPQTLDAGVY